MSQQRKIIETFTEMAPEYETIVDSELYSFWGWSYSEFVDQLIKATPVRDDDKVLDIATGTAVIPRKISGAIKENIPIFALDITPAMIEKARKKIKQDQLGNLFCFVTASAMYMPYCKEYFDVLFCGLATHHMNVQMMIAEMSRVLQSHGELSIADVGISPLLKLPVLRAILKMAAFFYFSFKDGIHRAWAEAEGVSNYRSSEEWYKLLQENGFENIRIVQMKSKNKWMPQLLLLRARKQRKIDVANQ
jgi:ubiquinone/menaquinone biosynthesis C-methylase UbiE